MRALGKRRIAYGLIAGAALTGALAIVSVPAYGQAAGVGNSGSANASSGGNASTGNASSNVADNTSTGVPLAGSVLGLVLNLTTSSTNTSTGTSNVTTGPAQASGNNTNTAVDQTSTGGGSAGRFIGGGGQVGTVSNQGQAAAATGGNTGTGNASTNVATNSQNVTGGLINIGLSLGNTASNNSSGTSTISSGPATASGNSATTDLNQLSLGGGGGVGGRGGPGGPGRPFGVGAGVSCDSFFGPGQVVNVSNFGSGSASTGGNTSVGNESTNVAQNTFDVTGGEGGLITIQAPGTLSNTASNNSTGTSNITTGAATASGNQATTAVSQECFQPTPFFAPGALRAGVRALPAVERRELARTGLDPFVVGLVAFSLLFAGLLVLVWERVESFPVGGGRAA